MFENNGYVHVYSPGAGADQTFDTSQKSNREKTKKGILEYW